MLKRLLLYFILAFLLMQKTFAVDSTQVQAPSTKPYKFSYILYRTRSMFVPNVFTAVPSSFPAPNNLLCASGYDACVSLQEVNSNNFNSDQCGVRCIYKQVTIKKNTTYNRYDIDYFYAYKMHGNHCDDRGGVFGLVITCVPDENVDPAALKKIPPPLCAK